MPPVEHPETLSAEPAASRWSAVAFPLMALVFLAVTGLLWSQYRDACVDYENKSREYAEKAEKNAKLQREHDNYVEFMNKYMNDMDFRMRVARERTRTVADGEIIVRILSPGASVAPPPATPAP